MAAKRITSSQIDWAALSEKVPPAIKPKFLAFKSKSEGYLRRVVSLPEAPPKIDWAFYKSKVPVPGLVDTFQKTYDSLTVPYPGDQGRLKEVEQQEAEHKVKLTKFFDEQRALILKHKEELAIKEMEIPYSQLTIEEYVMIRPESTFNPQFPTFYPHGEEETEYTKKLIKEGKLKLEDWKDYK